MKVYFLICLFFPVLTFAQKKDTILRYLDVNLQLTSIDKAVYYGVTIKENDHWLLYALYSDSTPVLKEYYKDKKLQIKDGPYILYYPKNKKAEQGLYLNNKRNGIWQSWYANGQRKDSGHLRDDKMVGLWKTWFNNGILMVSCNYSENSDSINRQMIPLEPIIPASAISGHKKGPFKSWYDNGDLESEGFFQNDLMEGEWKWYHKNGYLSTIENYSSGKLTAMRCFDTLGQEAGDFCSISKPATLNVYGDYKQFILQNLVWPEEALKKKIEGDVKVNFVINENGELENLVLESPYDILKKAVSDIFKSMGKWYPAVSHNRVIRWEEEFIIPFYQKQRE